MHLGETPGPRPRWRASWAIGWNGAAARGPAVVASRRKCAPSCRRQEKTSQKIAAKPLGKGYQAIYIYTVYNLHTGVYIYIYVYIYICVYIYILDRWMDG